MKLKILKDFGEHKAGEICEDGFHWMIVKGLAEPIKEEPKTEVPSDEFEELFSEPVAEEKPKKMKIKPANKAFKAPENK